ncbi:unnamed protein product [Amoebophrya sp. A25]|nr:unnamed protein product [Amoebophrya sp. A25]|eukprot:GSA25T00003913001.1
MGELFNDEITKKKSGVNEKAKQNHSTCRITKNMASSFSTTRAQRVLNIACPGLSKRGILAPSSSRSATATTMHNNIPRPLQLELGVSSASSSSTSTFSKRYFAVRTFEGAKPQISESAFVAPSADVIGNVTIDDSASVWYNCVLRGDVNEIRIGKRSNIQDGTVIHVRSGELGGCKPNPTLIGDDVTIGHSCLIHACTLHSGSFVGMQSCVMDFAVVESGAYVAAGALVLSNARVKSGELWGGRPAKFLRNLKDSEKEFLMKSATEYAKFGQRHKMGAIEVDDIN